MRRVLRARAASSGRARVPSAPRSQTSPRLSRAPPLTRLAPAPAAPPPRSPHAVLCAGGRAAPAARFPHGQTTQRFSEMASYSAQLPGPPAPPTATDSILTLGASSMNILAPATPAPTAAYTSSFDEIVRKEQLYVTGLESLLAAFTEVAFRAESLKEFAELGFASALAQVEEVCKVLAGSACKGSCLHLDAMLAELRRASGPGCVLLLLVELHRYLALDLLRNAGDTWVIAKAFALKWPQFEIYYHEYISLIPRLQQVVAAAAAAGLVDTVPGANGKFKVPMLEMLVAPERQLANYKMLFERMLKELPSIDPTQAARFNLLAFDGQLNSFLQRANAAPEAGKRGFMGTFVGFLDGMARWRKEAASSPVKGAGFPAPAPASAMGMLSTLLSPGQSKKRKQRDEDADAEEQADGGSPSKRRRAAIGRRWAR